MNNRYTKIVFFLLGINLGLAQNISVPTTVLSPNAYSLGKYGDVQMNYYTGKASVSVPLLSLNDNNLPLDLSLNYDTGGVRVSELPSWIGQNWNLAAGGVVCRTEKGVGCDETVFDSNWPTQNGNASGYWDHATIFNFAGWSAPNFLNGLHSAGSPNDYAPDIFTFNVMGHTGKFFLGQDGQWKVQSDSNIKVEINKSDNVLTYGRLNHCPTCAQGATPPKCIGKITLTDDQGNKYIFGNSPNAIEYSNNGFFNYNDVMTKATAWYLTSVIDRLGNAVYTLAYERSPTLQANFFLNKSFTRVYQSHESGWFDVGGAGCEYSTYEELLKGVLIMPVYLKTITSLNGSTITFNRSASDHKYYTPTDADGTMATRFYQWNQASGGNDYYLVLDHLLQNFYLFTHDANDAINVTGNDVNVLNPTDFIINSLKTYKLDEIVWSCNGILQKRITLQRNPTSERLNLAGVQIKEGASTVPLSYSFLYNNFNQLPYYISKAIDHWGYYRGANFEYYSYNSQNMNLYALHETTRTPVPAYLGIGSLKRITYPTKGYTEFEFERHDYAQYVNGSLGLTSENGIAGGLRVKSITTNDGISSTVKTFKYTTAVNSSVSSGILALKNRYWVTDYFTNTYGGLVYWPKSFSINNLLPMSNFSGSHIAYSKVYEIQAGNGYTEYQYTNYSDPGYSDTQYTSTVNIGHSIFDERNSNDFKRGHLKQVSMFSEQNPTQSVKTQTYNYQTIGSYKARAFSYHFFNPCPNSGDFVKEGSTYEIDYTDFKQTSMTESDYFATGTVSKTTTTSYATLPPTSSLPYFGSTFKRSESLTTNVGENKSAEYYYPFDYMLTSESNNMLGNNFVPVVESFNYKSGTLISKNKTAYMLMPDNGSRAMPVATYAAKGSDPYELLMTVSKYDPNGNILQYQLANGRVNSYRYTNNLLMFKVEGALSTESVTAANFSTFNATATKKATKYTYTPDRRLESITFPDGSFETYQYDPSLRLEKILDTNGKVLKKFEYKFQ